MKRKRLLIIIFSFLAVVSLAALLWPREREPEYNKVPLSAWLNGFEKLNRDGPAAKLGDISKSASAIRHIGTNALPHFIRWIRYEEPGWRRSVNRVVWKLPPAFLNGAAGRWLVANGARDRANRAVYGFAFLGTNATPALPELKRLAKEPSKGARQYRAELAVEMVTANIQIPEFNEVHNR